MEDPNRLAWKPAVEKHSDHTLKTGWYRFNNGLKKMNEDCVPQAYGGEISLLGLPREIGLIKLIQNCVGNIGT